MEALAEATCRSACAMSGRRSSKVEGIPTGIAGGVAVSGNFLEREIGAGFPISVAMASS
jgi:hypothetical protein